MTDNQKKILAYLKKRKNPVTLKQVYLQTRIEKRPCDQSLRALAKKGCVKTWMTMDTFVKERVYIWLTDEVKAPEKRDNTLRFTKRSITIDKKFFNNPFNLGA